VALLNPVENELTERLVAILNDLNLKAANVVTLTALGLKVNKRCIILIAVKNLINVFVKRVDVGNAEEGICH
jgi:hypothetical protein